MDDRENRLRETKSIHSDNGQLEDWMKRVMKRAMKMKSIADVLEEVDVLVDTHFFNELKDKVLFVHEEGHCSQECR